MRLSEINLYENDGTPIALDRLWAYFAVLKEDALCKKVCLWLAIISAIVLFITLGVVGVKLLDGNYDTNVEVII